jgi:hypothetical protein
VFASLVVLLHHTLGAVQWHAVMVKANMFLCDFHVKSACSFRFSLSAAHQKIMTPERARAPNAFPVASLLLQYFTRPQKLPAFMFAFVRNTIIHV